MTPPPLHPAIFLDRDGTLLRDVPYNADPGLAEFFPDAQPALRTLHGAGFSLVIVSNQSGVARGLFSRDDLATMDLHLRSEMSAAGAPLAGAYYCLHLPDASVQEYRPRCACRKPAPGLLLLAALNHRLDLSRSWMLGDILDDVETGRRAGCRSVLVDRGGETEWRDGPYRSPDLVARNLSEVAEHILHGSPVAA